MLTCINLKKRFNMTLCGKILTSRIFLTMKRWRKWLSLVVLTPTFMITSE